MLRNLPRFLISFAFLAFFVYSIKDEFPQVVETLKNIQMQYAVFGVIIFLAAVLLMAKRLEVIFRVHGMKLGFKQATALSFIGFFFNNFLPTSIGGDVVKAYCAGRMTGKKLKSFTCVLMDRIIGLMMFVVVPSATILFLAKELHPSVVITIFVMLGVASMAAVLIFNRKVAGRFRFLVVYFERFKWFETLRTVYDDLHWFRNHKGALATLFALSLIGQSMMILTVYCFIRALSADMKLIHVFLLTPIVNIMSMVPSINGLGVREKGFELFFMSAIGAPAAQALAILYLFLLIFLSIIGGIVYLIRHDLHFRFKEVSAP